MSFDKSHCKEIARVRRWQILFLLRSQVLMEGEEVTERLQIKAYIRQGNLLSRSCSSMSLINVCNNNLYCLTPSVQLHLYAEFY